MESTRSAPSVASTDAWQPLTPGGVAAFAGAPCGRLWLVAAMVAALVGAAVLRVAVTVWSPTVDTAIARLPAEGAIDAGRLVWPGTQAVFLADNAFVSIAVTPAGANAVAQSADLQFEFRAEKLTVTSLLGSLDLPYPQAFRLALNRPELEPLWGAWRPHLIAGVGAAACLGLLLAWALLGGLLAFPVRAYAQLLDRHTTLSGCWKLAVAALMPGALLMGVAIFAYSLGHLRAGELLIINGIHLLVGSGYLLISPLCLPGEQAEPSAGESSATEEPGNPFTAPPPQSPDEGPGFPESGGDNPFAGAGPVGGPAPPRVRPPACGAAGEEDLGNPS